MDTTQRLAALATDEIQANGASVMVSFGRGLGVHGMMTPKRWQQFETAIRGEIELAVVSRGLWVGGQYGVTIERHEGVGSWMDEATGEIITEESATLTMWGLSLFVGVELYEAIRHRLRGLAAQFGQDGIGVTIGIGGPVA